MSKLIKFFFKWLKRISATRQGYCQCEPHVDFTEFNISMDVHKKTLRYKCNKCGFVHQSWLFDGGRMYINPALVKYKHKRALSHINRVLKND
jgi:hypothetical protein